MVNGDLAFLLLSAILLLFRPNCAGSRMTIGYGGIPRRRQGRLQRRLSSRHRQLIAHAPVGRMASHAGARQRLNPSRRLRRGDLEQIRIDNGPFSPPGVLDEPGLLEPIEPARGRQRGAVVSAPFSIRELASVVLPRRWREGGMLLMLKAYFDDAGTHNGSPIAVMGGLIGTVAQWERLEDRWGKQLADPLPEAGKPRLQMFHMAECEASQGEFRDYSRPNGCWWPNISAGILLNAARYTRHLLLTLQLGTN